ncbi:hypothetical protein CAPTEDRAFT_217708, partial [Capitella teleta]|uniref:Centrosomal protein of 290kDa coiled-coil region domain-containing protein n=1 Tax=Capitella teleta TaxID=283909 RepID=X2AMK3_CAPTE
MAPLEWDELMEVTPDALENDDDLSEDMFENLQDFEADGESDATRLVQLFKVTQSVMKIKQSQLNVLEKEIEDMATEFGERNVKKDQEIEALKGECQTLRRENKDLQRMHPEGGGSGGGTHETRFLRDELMKFEEDIAQYQRDMKEKDQQLVEERELSEKYISRTEEAEKELRELRKESEQMREDIRDYQRQLEAQRESMLAKRDEDYEVRDKISGKNKLINMALEENKNLAETNVELEEKIERLKKEMAEGQTEVEHTTDQILKLRMVVEKSDEMAEHYRKKTQALQCQLDDLNEQVKSKTDADDEIMVQVNNKVEEWKGVLADKDERIYSLQEQLVQMREQLVAANMDTEKASVSMLTKALEERDKQIAVLQVRVDEAAIALEGNAALMEDFNSHMNKNTNDPQMKKITTLKNTLQSHETQLKDADKRALEASFLISLAEEDARAKDKQLSEVLERMSQYEQGIYGLPEAVTEIKDLKVQSSVKDRQVEELTQYINRVEMQLNDLNDENDDYRQRLGLGVREEVDLSEYRKKKNVRQQEDRALNHVLQKEIERLEEERISLKQQMRKIAQSSGQRAVALGLNADDMQEVNSLIEQLKAKRDGQEQASVTKIKSLAEREALKLKNQQLDKEVVKNEQKVEKLTQEVIRLKTKSTELEDENKGLEKGMREILDSLKEQSVSTDGLEVIQCPTLERMLAAMDSRNLIGTHDTSLYLKAQVDNLTGHNEELRRTLREIRFEATKANVELDKAQRKMVTMDEEIKELRESGAGAWFQTMSLPEGMAVSSSEVIASINEHLVQALQELSLKEGLLEKMETTLVGCQRKIAVMRHQKGMVYKEYHEQKLILEEARSKLEEELKHVQGLREDDQENTKVKTDMIAMETAVTERLGYLQRHKDMATFKIAALQKSLEDSVPASDLEAANKQYTELTEKYRDMLERSNTLVARSEESSGFEVEVKHLQDEKNALQQELTIEKEKLHTLEAAFENMRKQ